MSRYNNSEDVERFIRRGRSSSIGGVGHRSFSLHRSPSAVNVGATNAISSFRARRMSECSGMNLESHKGYELIASSAPLGHQHYSHKDRSYDRYLQSSLGYYGSKLHVAPSYGYTNRKSYDTRISNIGGSISYAPSSYTQRYQNYSIYPSSFNYPTQTTRKYEIKRYTMTPITSSAKYWNSANYWSNKRDRERNLSIELSRSGYSYGSGYQRTR